MVNVCDCIALYFFLICYGGVSGSRTFCCFRKCTQVQSHVISRRRAIREAGQVFCMLQRYQIDFHAKSRLKAGPLGQKMTKIVKKHLRPKGQRSCPFVERIARDGE